MLKIRPKLVFGLHLFGDFNSYNSYVIRIEIGCEVFLKQIHNACHFISIGSVFGLLNAFLGPKEWKILDIAYSFFCSEAKCLGRILAKRTFYISGIQRRQQMG